MAMLAVTMQIWQQHRDFPARVDVARSAIAEHLYASDEAPDVETVLGVACRAIADHVQVVHGDCCHGDTTAGHIPGVDWPSLGSWVQHDESDSVVENVALSQIWPALSTAHREIFLAIALYGDREKAARSLGKSPASFATQLTQARREFLRQWNEGERPRHSARHGEEQPQPAEVHPPFN
ncbi:hypothetical protein [Streptomyces sp. WAC 06738]|uniref:hypothetical protein n=1 Tax=Streptomyces sp. WAC 06738 TaxID=2203210 RepID=UPI000F78945C|nr:hypothetical protein [Streptomyces sp. WAC 06738]